MKRVLVCAACLAAVVGILAGPSPGLAAITADHRKEITEIGKEISKVTGLLSRKDYEDAEKILNESEEKLKKIATDAGVDENNLLLAPYFKRIALNRTTLAKKKGDAAPAGGGVFEKEVAPILTARCLGCHGEDQPKGGLQMTTFAGIVKGGTNGRLIVPGNPNASLVVQRITAMGNQRMPRGGNPLTADEIKKISAWISQGAKFTGDNSTPIDSLPTDGGSAKPAPGPVTISKATGNEKVSFAEDIAPFMVNLCMGCHSGNGQGVQRTGFALDTFEKLMKGGRGGRVVLPGNTKDSKLWQLVGEQDPIKMPQGQARITRTNHTNLRIWIEEGAKFDGPDPKAPLRSYVLTEAEKQAKKVASMSAEELAQLRKQRSDELWKALGKETPTVIDNAAFILMGNTSESRLKEFADWADDEAKSLKKLFGIREANIWKGKLTIFVFKDRFSYEEFTRTNQNAEVPSETKGHSRVTANLEDAYLCVQDVGDESSDDSPSTKVLLSSLMAEALLQRSTNKVPDWVARGTGLALAARSDPKNPYFRGLGAAAANSVKSLQSPQDIFKNGTFSSSDLTAVGYTLVSFMLSKGESHFVNFLNQILTGKRFEDALKAVYSADAMNLAISYLNGLGSGVKPVKKAKK